MSRAPHEAFNAPNAGIITGDDQYPVHSAPNQTSHGAPDYVDSSGLIFSMYLERAEEEDKKMTEGWKADADGILIFTGLFSAAVASLISVSVQDIRLNPQDTSNFYLSNIYQVVTNPNISSSLPASPPPFSPPNYAIWVNALWFMSLVISLTCALLATLLQQWARRYLKVTHPRYSIHKRARIRAFFAEGVERSLLPLAVEALPTLLHVSLFLFFAGLVVFLCHIDLTIFKLVLSWVSICTALYGCITFMPVFRHDSPYKTPLSSPAWHIITRISFTIIWWFTLSARLLDGVLYYRFRHLKESYRKMLAQGVQKTAEETALNSPSGISARAFMWTFDSLDEDHEQERFFSGLPGFRSSKVVDDPLPSLTSEQRRRLSTALVGLFDRTVFSDLVPQPIKDRRAITCVKALDAEQVPYASRQIVNRILFYEQCRGLQTAEFANTVRGWENQGPVLVARAIVTGIVARVKRQDDAWFALASSELGIPESVLREYATQGDSLSLAVLIHVTRQQFIHYRTRTWPKDELWQVLKAASMFNVQDTSPELQHEFCALWNQIVLKVLIDNNQWMAWYILGPIRNIYIALHRGTGSAPTRFSASTTDYDPILKEPSSYPLCNIPGHHPLSTHVYDVSASTPAVSHDHEHTALALSFFASSPCIPSSSAYAPHHLNDENLALLDNATPNPATTHGTSAERMHFSTAGPSASDPPPTPMASISPPGAQHASFSPEFRSLLAPGPSRPLGRLSSSPVLGGASAEGEGSPDAAAERDARSAVREYTNMAAPDLLPHSSSSVSEVAIAGPSSHPLGAEHTGDRDSSHGPVLLSRLRRTSFTPIWHTTIRSGRVRSRGQVDGVGTTAS